MLPSADELQVEEVARRTGVSVPTVYSHFGSKGGLLSAVVGQIERQLGLFAGFAAVWGSPDGESALRTMLESTVHFWEEAWVLIEFALRVRRTDHEIGAGIDRLDRSRLGHLEVICRRLEAEGRLRPEAIPADAAALAFALTTPYVYEALVVQGSSPREVAHGLMIEAAVGAVLRPGTRAVTEAQIDWKGLGLKPPVV